MTGWRHVERGWDKACGGPSDVEGFINCGCAIPTPDLTAPCGFEDCRWHGRECHCDDPAEGCQNDHPISVGAHPFVPTRCTCGHPIEPVR